MMNTHDFMDFCYDLMIAEEKLDVSILDGFGGGNLTLFHASPLKLKVINPTSWNIGNRLNPRKRKSSFWTKSIDYSILWSLDWVMLRMEDLPYIHDIENYKFYVPDITIDENKNGTVIATWTVKDWILQQLKERPVYIYEAEVPKALVSKGQFNIDEYTVDIPVVPSKTYIVTPKDAAKVIETLPVDKFNELSKTKIGDTRKRNPSIKERLVYRNPNKVIRERTKRYNREHGSYGHVPQPVFEALYEWDDLSV